MESAPILASDWDAFSTGQRIMVELDKVITGSVLGEVLQPLSFKSEPMLHPSHSGERVRSILIFEFPATPVVSERFAMNQPTLC